MVGIASRFGLDYQTLLDANELGDADFLYVGQELAIPVVEQALTPSGRTHTVQPGETLWGIAQQYDVDYTSLLRANAISDPDHITDGQVLVLPDE